MVLKQNLWIELYCIQETANMLYPDIDSDPVARIRVNQWD